MYRMMYQSCIDVLREQKSPLTKALLEKEVGREKFLELQQFEFDELIEKMIYDLKKQVYASSYEDVKVQVRLHKRYLEFVECFKGKNLSNNLVMLSFRIPQIIIEEVYKLKKDRLGEVVELAISLYLVNCEEKIFELTYLAFHHYERK